MKSLLISIIFWGIVVLFIFFLTFVIQFAYNNFNIVGNIFVDLTSILCVGLLVDKIVNKLDKL